MNRSNPTPSAPRSRLKWRQFSLRALLVAMTIMSVAGGWFGSQLRWKKDRAAARTYQLDIDTTYIVLEEWPFGADAPRRKEPPRVLQWFGEEQAAGVVVLATDPDRPESSEMDRSYLARLFPEAQIAMLGDRDCPLDLVGFTVSVSDSEELALRTAKSQRRFEADCQERQLLADRRLESLRELTRLDRSAPAPRADRRGQLLRMERRLEATQLELATTHAERAEVLAKRSQQLQMRERAYAGHGKTPAARRGSLACRAELARLAEDRAWLDKLPDRHEWDETEIAFLQGQSLSDLQLFQKIAVLYLVGAKGGEKEAVAIQGIRLAAGGARIAEIKADHSLASVQWLHACQFADMGAAAYAELMALSKDMGWLNVPEYCQVLSDRADIKLARHAYRQRSN
jgi:hypothetical protein